MALHLFLSSTLRKQFPDYKHSQGIPVDEAEGMTIKELCDKLNIPIEKVKIIMINGRSAGIDDVLRGDERVALFPPVGGG